jgi:flagellar protein FliS
MAMNGYNTYKNNSVNMASKEQLLLMLLDGAVKYAKMARLDIENKKIQEAHKHIMRTEDIFIELMNALDLENSGDWAVKLMSVYEFINNQLVLANIKKDINILDNIIPIIEDIRDTWNEAYRLSKTKQ